MSGDRVQTYCGACGKRQGRVRDEDGQFKRCACGGDVRVERRYAARSDGKAKQELARLDGDGQIHEPGYGLV